MAQLIAPLAALAVLGAVSPAGASPVLSGVAPTGGTAPRALTPTPHLRLFRPAGASAGVLAARQEPLRRSSTQRSTSAPLTTAPPASRAIITSCAVPGAPGSPAAGVSGGANQASVSWTAANGNGTTISAYVVREVTGPNVGASIATNGSATSAILTGLAGASAATFSVVAESSCGTGPAATTSAVTPTGTTSTYLRSVQATAPSVFYRLDEPSGTVMADSSGHGLDGTYSGQEGLLAAPPLASDAAPSSSYTTCCSGIGSGSSSIPAYGSARTIESWVQTTSGNGNQAIVGYGPTTTDEAFVLSLSSQSINVDAWNDYLSFPAPRPLNTGTWHMIDASFDGSTLSVYLDGQLIGSSPFTGMLNTMPTSPELAGFPGYNFLNGLLGDVSIYPTGLTGAQIRSHFAGSGYSVPTAPAVPHATTGGSNAVQVSWGASTATNTPVTGYIVGVISGEHGSSVAVNGDATAARLTGLAAGTYTVQITPLDAYGTGPTVTTNSVTVTGATATYASTVISANPSAFYRLSDTTSAAMADSSGHAATGIYDAAVTLSQPGPLPNDNAPAISSSATTPVGGSNAFLPLYASPRTLEAWFTTTSCCGTQWLAGYGTTSTAQGFSVGVQPNAIYVQGYSDDLVFSSPVALNDGLWHFVAVSTDGTNVTAFVDGVPIRPQTFPQTLDTLPGHYPQSLLIGSSVGGCCGQFSGQLADVAIFPTALTSTSIAAEFNASGLGRPPAPTSPGASAGANAATVTWTAPTRAYPAVTGYLVTALRSGVAANAVSVPAATTSTTITGLAGGGSYTFRVQAINPYGAGAAATTSTPATPTGATATYASTTVADAPLAFYRLADAFSAMADSSGHGATGFYGPAATLGQPGPLGNDTATAISDNASNLAGQAVPLLPLYNGARTLEAWINTTSCCTSPWLAGYGSTSTSQGFAIGAQPNTVLVSGYSDDLAFASPVPLNNGIWHLIAVTTNGTSATAFVDGAAIGTQNFPQPLDTLAPTSGPQGLVVGGGIGNCCGYFNGEMADIALFGTQLTAAQITAQFAASGLAAPPAPTSPNATAGVNQASVSWIAPTAANPAITGYLVTALKSGVAANAITVPAGAASATVTGLVAGGSYTFRIRAINAYGPGAPATTATAVIPTGTATTYASTVLASTPSVFWRLADTGSALVADSSGHGGNGYYNTGAATLNQTGPFSTDAAGAVSDNGQVPLGQGHPALPLYSSARSVEVWMNTTSCCGQSLVGYGQQTTNAGFSLGAGPNTVTVSGYGDDFTLASPVPLNNGVWHFLAVTTDGTSATIYVDGAAIGTRNFPHVLNTLPAVQGLLLGNGIGGCCGGFSGQLADLAIFPSALTAAQVRATFAASGLGAPSAPTGAGATPGANQANVTWTAPTSVNPPIKGFLVTALKSGVAANAIAVPSTATSATVTGLVGGGSYTFQIQAVNSYGPGAVATTTAVTPTGASSTYASTVLGSAPSAFYRLADSTASILADSSGHHAIGAYGSASTLNQGGPLPNDSASSISDNGSTYAAQAMPSLPLYSAPRTIEGWINTTSGNQNFIAGYGATNTAQGFMLAEQPTRVILSGYGDDLSITSPVRLNDGNWHFIAATTDGMSVTAYVDGKAIGTRKFPQTLNTQPTQSGLLIGDGTQGCCGGLSGGLADIAVFPAALSTAQINAQFAASGLSAPPPPTSPGAVAGANQASVSWVAPSGANPAISGYLVTALRSGAAANAQSVPASATSTTITGLVGGAPYTFRIQAVNTYGLGAAATTTAVIPSGATSTYASKTLSLGPSAFYRLGDTAASALADSSGHGATGVYTPSATLGQPGPLTGDASGSVLGNGNGAIAQAYPTVPLYNAPRTVEAWMKTTNGGTQTLVGYGTHSTSQAFGVQEQPNAVYVYSWSNDLSFASTITLDDGNWHFVAVTSDGSTATAYVDGTSLGTQTFSTPLDTLPSPDGLTIGSPQFSCCGSFGGTLADIAVFPSALTAAQISGQRALSRPVSLVPPPTAPIRTVTHARRTKRHARHRTPAHPGRRTARRARARTSQLRTIGGHS